MTTSKGILVLKKHPNHDREVRIDLGSNEILNSGFLSDFDLDSIIDIIAELTQVVNGTLDSMYWGQEQIMIGSEQLTSDCFDEMNNENLGSVSTQELLNLMIQIRDFKQLYQNPYNLKNLVGQAFNTIKSSPNNYKTAPHSDFYYSITISDIYISLVLESGDFNLSESDYTNQLQTNF